jgi:putative chitinase
MPYSAGRLATFAQPLLDAMQEFGITTAKRQAAFLAQVSHESGELRYTLELADGTGYEGRADLGNTKPGDGAHYKGRGLIQITGRTNYEACGNVLDLPLIIDPSLLEVPAGACRSAAWFWQSRGLNGFAEADKFSSITKTINGGYNHLDERLAYWLRARATLGL